MFDTVHLHSRTEAQLVPYTKTVIEKKAPTDDSIRLYEEIKEKAYKSILRSIKIDDNIIKANGIIYEDLLTCNIIFAYSFSVNGIMFKGKEEIDRYYEKDILLIIYKKASEHITKELLKHVPKK